MKLLNISLQVQQIAINIITTRNNCGGYSFQNNRYAYLKKKSEYCQFSRKLEGEIRYVEETIIWNENSH